MNPFDHFVKRELRIKYYLRYADDFTLLATNKSELEQIIFPLQSFLWNSLKLEIHPTKIKIEKWSRGIDILGSVIYPYYQHLRTKTKKRAFHKVGKAIIAFKKKKIDFNSLRSSVYSYTGIFSHVSSNRLNKKLTALIKSLSVHKDN